MVLVLKKQLAISSKQSRDENKQLRQRQSTASRCDYRDLIALSSSCCTASPSPPPPPPRQEDATDTITASLLAH